MNFTIDSKVKFDKNAEPPTVAKIKTYLNKLPDGQLLTTRNLTFSISTSYSTLTHLAYWFKEYMYHNPRGNSNLWGNRKTIKEFKKINEKI